MFHILNPYFTNEIDWLYYSRKERLIGVYLVYSTVLLLLGLLFYEGHM